jgi:hypothetical protein
VACEKVLERGLADRIGGTSYGEAAEPATVSSRMNFSAVVCRGEVARFVEICKRKDECFRSMVYEDVDGGMFGSGPQVVLGFPGAACTAELNKAETTGLPG